MILIWTCPWYFTSAQIIQLENVENPKKQWIWTIFDVSSHFFFVNTMLRLMKRPVMTEQISILQAPFIFSSLYLPDYTLLFHLLSHIKSNSDQSQWHRWSKTVLWQHCSQLNLPISMAYCKTISYNDIQYLIQTYCYFVVPLYHLILSSGFHVQG